MTRPQARTPSPTNELLQDEPVNRPHLSTDRLDLEPMTAQHLPLLVGLDSDAEVLRHILGRARSAPEVHDFWGPICADAGADAAGLGWWIGRRRGDGDFVGWWDLSPARAPMQPPARAEAGWRLRQRHWGQGYATEGAAALLDHGFTTAGLREVWAQTMAVNTPSRRVMEKLGMRHTRTDHLVWDQPLPGAELGDVTYEISKDEWLDRRPQTGPRA